MEILLLIQLQFLPPYLRIGLIYSVSSQSASGRLFCKYISDKDYLEILTFEIQY